MPLPTVWPEHPEVSGVIGLHDCTQCAACMALEYAGFTAFPLGINTVAERNALDASDDRPDNTGATLDGSVRTAGWLDKQVLNRYGVRMHRLPDDSQDTFRKFLSTPGYAFLVQGSMKSLGDTTHPLRRWEPQFGGGHAVCVITGTRPRWLDPLGPLGFAGDLTDVDTVLRFAWDGAAYSRYMKKDELVAVPDTATEEDMNLIIRERLYPSPRDIRCIAPFKGADVDRIRAYRPPEHVVVKTSVPKSPTHFWAAGEVEVQGWSKDPNRIFHYWLGDHEKGGEFVDLYVAQSDLTQAGEFDPIDTGLGPKAVQAAIDSAVNTATQPLLDRIQKIRAKVSALATDVSND